MQSIHECLLGNITREEAGAVAKLVEWVKPRKPCRVKKKQHQAEPRAPLPQRVQKYSNNQHKHLNDEGAASGEGCYQTREQQENSLYSTC